MPSGECDSAEYIYNNTYYYGLFDDIDSYEKYKLTELEYILNENLYIIIEK